METITIIETEEETFILCNEGQLNQVHSNILKTTIFSIENQKLLIEILDNKGKLFRKTIHRANSLGKF